MQRKITFQNVIPLTHTLILSTLVNSITVYVTWTHEGGYKWYHLFLLPFRHISVLTEEKETCLTSPQRPCHCLLTEREWMYCSFQCFRSLVGQHSYYLTSQPKWSPLFIDHINNKKWFWKAAYLFQNWTTRSTVTNICRNLKFKESNDPY